MRYLTNNFGGSRLILYFCRRICDVIRNISSHKVEKRHVSKGKNPICEINCKMYNMYKI